MAVNKIEIQDENGNIYHPHTTSDVVFDNDGRSLKDNINSFFYSHKEKSGDLLNITNYTSGQYYSLFNALAAEFPYLLEQTTLGKDQSNTKDIKKIVYTPSGGYSKTLMITCGVHGDEPYSPYYLYLLLNYLCKSENLPPQLDFIKRNVRIVAIEVVNPYGMDASPKTRYNSRHVDINRNFDFNWSNQPSYTTDPTHPYYKGSAPFSEKESQYVRDVMSSYSIDGFLDLHNFVDVEAKRDYVLYGDEVTEKISKEVFRYLNIGHSYVAEILSTANDSCTNNYASKVKGIPAICIECVRKSGNIGDYNNQLKFMNLITNYIICMANISKNSATDVGGIVMDRMDFEYPGSSTVSFPASKNFVKMEAYDKTVTFDKDGILLIDGFVTGANLDSQAGVVPSGSTSLDPRVTTGGATTNRLNASYAWGLAYNLPISMRIKVAKNNPVKFELWGCYDGSTGAGRIKRVKIDFVFIPIS